MDSLTHRLAHCLAGTIRQFALGFETGAFGLGVLYAAGAVGVMIGPVVARRLSDGTNLSLRRWLLASFIVTAVCSRCLPVDRNLLTSDRAGEYGGRGTSAVMR